MLVITILNLYTVHLRTAASHAHIAALICSKRTEASEKYMVEHKVRQLLYGDSEQGLSKNEHAHFSLYIKA
ncbi:hypothetical protein GCM10007082_09280 [Oceanisphaera arctica]|nr:hypothetical protein GCM10007082_09280 [Oceanisphaera arctica]